MDYCTTSPTQAGGRGQLIHDALHDALTGLPNRALFILRRVVNGALQQAKAVRGLFIAVLFLEHRSVQIVNDSLEACVVGINSQLRSPPLGNACNWIP